MAKVTNSNFISMIKAYGPWADNEMQFEEHVRKNAKRNNVAPLEYQTPYASSIESVKNVLSAGHSQILLICGRAGDGKTHFLGKLFEDEGLLNLGTESWQELLDSSSSILTLEQVQGFRLTVVRDLTQVQDDDTDEQQLFCDILSTLESNSAHTDSARLGTNIKPDSTQSKLIVIAGNNGKILEKLSNLKTKLQQHVQNVTRTESTSHTGYVENADANPASVLMRFMAGLSLERSHSILETLSQLITDLKLVFIENRKVTNHAITIIDMSNRVNDEVMDEIFSVILEHKCWHNCQSCDYFSKCPIYRNRELLLTPWVQQRLKRVLYVLKADGFYPTIRNVQTLIINGLLGRGFNSDIKSSDLSCIKVGNNIKANAGICTFESNVYDNLVGLNFSRVFRNSRPIFAALSRLKLGAFTSKTIDRFLLNEGTEEQQNLHRIFIERFDLWKLDEQLQQSLEALNQSYLNAKDQSKDRKYCQKQFDLKLQALRRMLFFTVGAPLYAPAQTIDQAIEQCDVANTVTQVEFQGCAQAVRQFDSQATVHFDARALDYDNTAECFINPYLLTNYPHAHEYQELQKLVQAQTNDTIGKNQIAQALILGLNRVFTGLLSENDTNAVYVPANCINKNSNLSIMYDANVFRFDAYSYSVSRTINLVMLEDCGLPGLQFLDEQVDSQRNDTTLVLTPYMFECLMNLSEGVTCLTLPQQAVHELLVFKDRIFSILEQHISYLMEQQEVHDILQSMVRLTVGENGNIAFNKTINV